MKMLDPGSVVRESEFATAQNAAGVPDIIRSQYNRVKDGLRLGDNQRKDFVTRAQSLYAAKVATQDNLTKRYTELAKRYDLNPENVIYNITAGVNSEPIIQKKLSDYSPSELENLSVDVLKSLLEEEENGN